MLAIRCLDCGHEHSAQETLLPKCEACGSGWLDAIYDENAVSPLWHYGLGNRELSLWRYEELLPIQRTHPESSMGEGWTPLTRLYSYEQIYQHQGMIYVKDERAQPTNSFKDRQAALTVIALQQKGIKEIVLASTGNAGVAYAAYCARAGIKLWLFVTSLVPAEKMREAALYGCKVVKVSGTYDETKHVAEEFALRQGVHLDRGAKAVPGKESMKTLAFEIAEQLGLKSDKKGGWVAPDWYIQAVSGGIGPLGVWKGFSQLQRMGFIDKMPKLGIVQAAGCAPMVNAFLANAPKATPVTPETLITVLATGDPGKSYELLLEAVKSNGGTMLALEDGDTFVAMRQLASKGGLSVEPATAVAFGGLERMLKEGTIQPHETVVINCSGHTFLAEGHVLGDQYEQYVLEAQKNAEGKPIMPQVGGITGAIQNLDGRVKTIVLVDDSGNDRRLIRKLLRSHKRYVIHEADNGRDGMKAMYSHNPDLIILDLTLPDMDGLTMLETIQRDSQLRDIPLIVYSARDLTHAERDRIESLNRVFMPKTGLDREKLLSAIEDELSSEG